MSNPKVFEFAKEIGLTPLALMDKIREWQMPVKSHMAELDPELLQQIKTKLGEENSPKTASRVTVKKTAAKKPAAKKEDSKPKPPVNLKAKVKAKTEEEPEPVMKASTAAVVRRKTKEEVAQAEEAAIEAAAPAVEVEAPVKKVVRRATPAEEAPAMPETEVVAPIEVVAKKAEPIVIEKEIEIIAEEPAPEVQQASPVEESPVIAEPVKTEPVRTSPAVVPSMRKKEVVVGQSGASSSQTPVSVGPRRNIVGRMDLSRVAPPPQQQRPQGGRPQGGGYQGNNNNTGGDNRGGYQGNNAGGDNRGGYQGNNAGGGFQRPGGSQMGPPRSGTRNIRTGFIAQPVIPEFVDDDSKDRKSKFEDRNKKAKVFGATPAPEKTEREGEGEFVFNATEFRKREMVFQPKKKKGLLNRVSLQTQITTPKAIKRILKVDKTMKVSDAAQEMGIKATELTKVLMKNGVMATMNTALDFDTLALIVTEFGWEAQNIFKSAEATLEVSAFGELGAERITRPPVVTVMGHVDHGKTSLLDAIRKTDVAAGEKGGITQHIGAYNVTLDDGHIVTFLDTPGHEAFTAMRARGANATDIAVIVVAADDGVMPQTAEAISHAKAAGVPIIVAVNKIDRPGANVERIKQQLTEHEIVPEEWGGTTIFCEVSALQKTGIKELLEQIILVAEIQELKANPKRSGTGVVIESRVEKGRGTVVTLLVQDGTIEIGQDIVAGFMTGRVRGLTNDKGERVKSAGPGTPVEMIGLSGAPSAGDRFDIVKDEKTAEQVSQIRKEQIEKINTNPHSKMSLDELFSKVSQGETLELPIVIKTDVMGSLEAIQGMVAKLATAEVKMKIIHSAVGGISESDVLLASTSKGMIIGFNVRPDTNAIALAKRHNIEIRTYGIVYELMDDLKKAMQGLLTPDVVEKVMGRAEVRNTFSVPKIGMIGGCSVVEGKISRSNMVRLIRDSRVIYEGKIGSLKRFKDDAKEVAQGFECGIGIENYNDLKVGDVIEAFVKEEVARELSAPLANA